MKSLLALICLALALPVLADDDNAPAKKVAAKPEPGMRTFTSSSGKTVEGKVISRIDDETFLLRNPEGNEFKLRLSALSDSDKVFLEIWQPDMPIDLAEVSLEDALPKMGYSSAEIVQSGIGPVVTLKIDDTTFKMLIDPKRTYSLIDKEAADNANFDLSNSTSAFKDAAGNRVVAQQYKKPGISFGGSDPISSPILVIALEVIGGAAIKNEADGIMGADLLKSANALLDFNENKLHVKP